MIELRYVLRDFPVGQFSDAGLQISETRPVLQYRTHMLDLNNEHHPWQWTAWQDVPTVPEELRK